MSEAVQEIMERIQQLPEEDRLLLDEMLSFPVGKHDDLLDATAFGTAFLLDTPEPRVF